MNLSEQRIKEIRERWAKATPGPWGWFDASDVIGTGDIVATRLGNASTSKHILHSAHSDLRLSKYDAEAIAHAPEDIKWLLAR